MMTADEWWDSQPQERKESIYRWLVRNKQHQASVSQIPGQLDMSELFPHDKEL